MFWADVESAFAVCSRAAILSLGYTLASCEVLKKNPCSNPTLKSDLDDPVSGLGIGLLKKNL